MPRESSDEPGTDHSVGVALAEQLVEQRMDDATVAYRAMVVVTDGQPRQLSGASGTRRAAEGDTVTRWRELAGPVLHSVPDIRGNTVAATETLWRDLRVHTGGSSLVANDPILRDMVQGDGYAVRTHRPEALSSRLTDIVGNLLLVVE